MKMVVIMYLEEDQECVKELLGAVSECRSISDPRHPVRALQIPVEATSVCNQPSVD